MKKKNFFILVLMAGLGVVLMNSLAMSEPFNLFGRPANIAGYVTQGGSFSLVDKDKYDVEKGFNGALMNLFVEGEYSPIDRLKFYASSMLSVDWIYQLKDNDSSWNDKLFNKSRDRLNVDDKYWQLLKEAHFTWTPENFLLRVGKHTVSWGEMMAFRVMDQINPLDQRRGMADVEFETSIIPIWLLRAEYYLPTKPSWLQDLGFEFIWNPNADFIPNQGPKVGNDAGGIWAPNIQLPGPPPYWEMHLGSTFDNIRTPKRWTEGNEFAFRVKGVVKDTIITLNAFYGRDNDPVTLSSPFPPLINIASDGRFILQPFQEGKYPLFRFVGATVSRDIPPLRASSLGGVAPTVFLETFYAFKDTFTFSDPITGMARFEKSDEFRGAAAISWKINIPLLNPRAYFSMLGEFYWRKIMDYPSIEVIQGLKKNNYQTFLTINTSYFHNKLTPSIAWMYDINSKSGMFRPQLVYDYTNKWHFTLGATFLHGEKRNQGLQVFDNKDQIYFKVSYKWG